MEKEYLRVSKAADLENSKDRALFRLLEIFPGALSFLTLFLLIFLSWKKPFWVAIAVIVFIIFWLFRIIYFYFHLRSGFLKMKEHEKINWMEKLKEFSDWRDVYHLIVLPMYKEPLEIVRETFLSLENNDYPKDRMIIVLACEERAIAEAKKVAQVIEKEFKNEFFRFFAIFHPKDLPGEIAGKGSNESFAAEQAKEIIDALKIPYEYVIFSSFDVDTFGFPKYFSCLTYHYLKSEKRTRKSFQPIPLFINNIWQASSISRIFSFSSTFWHTMNQERPEKLITFSSHSMSFKALVDVGFKLRNIVPDDSRIFWQCFLHYEGDYEVVPIFYPISMDANVARNFWRTVVNIYKQQRRWAYGASDIAYFLFGFTKNKKIPLSKKFSLAFELIEGHWSWATASIIIFFSGWLPLYLGGEFFSQSLISYNLPIITRNILFWFYSGFCFPLQ